MHTGTYPRGTIQVHKKSSEETLKEPAAPLGVPFDLLPDPAAIVDTKGKILAVNTALEQTTGFKRDELVGTNFLRTRAFPTASKVILAKALAKRMLGAQRAPYEVEYLTKEGEKKWTEVNANKIKHCGATVVLVLFRDITDNRRMKTELERYSKDLERQVEERTQELKKSEETFRHIFNSSLDAMYTTSFDGKIIDMNPAGVALFGFSSPDEMREVNAKILYVNPQDRKKMLNLVRRGSVRNFEARMRRKDGAIIDCIINVYALRDETGAVIGIQGSTRDITTLKQAGERLRKAERLVAIGETAMMVGHDLRNPLQVMMNMTFLAKEAVQAMPANYGDTPEGQALTKFCNTIQQQTGYMEKVVSDLQDLAGPMKLELTETNLPKMVEDTLQTITIPANIDVSKRIEYATHSIKVDPALMRRMLTNLVTNAIQAMPNGGQLTIEATRAANVVVISVEDTGVGISRENLERIFEPLFTTKSKGQGLGLPVCKRIVDAHGGRITVKSEAGKGSTFRVMIPTGGEPKHE